jgi:hypothetical protein
MVWSFLISVSIISWHLIFLDLLCKFIGLAARDNAEDEQVGDSVGVVSVLLQRLVQSSLGFFCSAKVQFADSLRNKASY